MVEDAIGFDDYDYPEVVQIGAEIGIALGWFMIDDDDGDEAASYLETYIDSAGKVRVVLDVRMDFAFDFGVKLRDHGYWVQPPLYDEQRGAKPYFVYADHHIPLRDRARYFLKNLPFRTKKRFHIWACLHMAYYSDFSRWRYQRKMEKVFR